MMDVIDAGSVWTNDAAAEPPAAAQDNPKRRLTPMFGLIWLLLIV